MSESAPRPRPTGSLTILVAIHSRYAAWNIPAGCVDRLRHECPSHRFLHATSEAEALASIAHADVVFTSELRAAQLAAAPRLRWIHSPAAGVGSMLFPAMLASAVVITNSRGLSAATIAEHVLAVTLAIFRKLPLAVGRQRERCWAQDAMLEPPGIRTIHGARVLVVGLGSIGAAAAARMSALGAHVTGIRRRASEPPPAGIASVATPDRLRELLPHADVVVLAAPLTSATHAVIGAAELAAMRPGAVLVNVSRGKLVDERALAAALKDGPVGGAALDVFEHEPLAMDSPLWDLPNVLITPHVSGFRPDHWEAVTALFVDQLRRFERGEPLLNVVDKVAGY